MPVRSSRSSRLSPAIVEPVDVCECVCVSFKFQQIAQEGGNRPTRDGGCHIHTNEGAIALYEVHYKKRPGAQAAIRLAEPFPLLRRQLKQ